MSKTPSSWPSRTQYVCGRRPTISRARDSGRQHASRAVRSTTTSSRSCAGDAGS
uniref:Uncharacterized protein n=1 Tax=Arundo donax TaxID=35708 RepID=A0A0A9UBP0_ARUDO